MIDDDVWNLRTSVSRGQSEIAVDRYAAVFLSDRMLAACWIMTGSIRCVQHHYAICWDRALYGVICYATAQAVYWRVHWM